MSQGHISLITAYLEAQAQQRRESDYRSGNPSGLDIKKMIVFSFVSVGNADIVLPEQHCITESVGVGEIDLERFKAAGEMKLKI